MTDPRVSPDARPSPAAPLPAAHIAQSRTAAVASLLGLIVLGLAWELWLAPLRPGGSWWVIKILPLLPALPGLLKNRMYTYRWLSLLVWLYFTEGVVRATSEGGLSAGLALLQVILCVALFVACTLHIRLRLRDAKVASAATTNATDTATDTQPTA